MWCCGGWGRNAWLPPSWGAGPSMMRVLRSIVTLVPRQKKAPFAMALRYASWLGHLKRAALPTTMAGGIFSSSESLKASDSTLPSVSGCPGGNVGSGDTYSVFSSRRCGGYTGGGGGTDSGWAPGGRPPNGGGDASGPIPWACPSGGGAEPPSAPSRSKKAAGSAWVAAAPLSLVPLGWMRDVTSASTTARRPVVGGGGGGGAEARPW
mmetsp:Transcript_36981/g.114195  ORF Transcript_36981/g.114195 Transcript_36981/m.114195 type:complete len:208 (+) Transcript_36981:194-817(+)